MAYWVFKALLSPVLFLLWRVKAEGREHVPAHGPVVLAANHQSFCDSFFLPLVLRRRVTYVAKAEYFDRWRTAWFFRAAGQIPMNRAGGDASQRALDTARTVLEAGGLLAIYPEGTRAPDPRLHRGHTGAARLALRCGAPLIPVGIVGTRAIQPPGRRIMRPFRPVTLRFGAPVATGSRDALVPADGEDPAALREFTDVLMAEIARLSGQEYVDVYANARRRADQPAVRAAEEVPRATGASGPGAGSPGPSR